MEADPETYPSPCRTPALLRLAACLRDASGRSGVAGEAALCVAATVLFARHLRFDAADPDWPDRDRLIASGPAAAIAQDAAGLSGCGPGLVANLSGPASHALGAALGAAMAERMIASRFGRSLVDHSTWVLAEEADLATGAAQEAAGLAGQLQLGRLTILASVRNGDSACLGCFAALGWAVRRSPANDPDAIEAGLSAALRSRKPTLVACMGDTELPSDARGAGRGWAAIGRKGAVSRRAWLKRLTRHAQRKAFEREMAGRLSPRWQAELAGTLPATDDAARLSTADTIRTAVARLSSVIPELAGLPIQDACSLPPLSAGSYGGRSVDWGSSSQAMALALDGMAMHGGVLPIGRLSLQDGDAIRPAVRAAALLGLRVVHVLIEPAAPCPAGGQLAGWRSMRNLHVYRPANSVEALECGELALRRTQGPSLLLLSETGVPVPPAQSWRRSCARGAYIARAAPGLRDATLIASGPELALALAAQARLAGMGISVACVSLPCWQLFEAQGPAWREALLGHALRIGVEACGGFGWDRWLGPDGVFVGNETHHGGNPISADRLVDLIARLVRSRRDGTARHPNLMEEQAKFH